MQIKNTLQLVRIFVLLPTMLASILAWTATDELVEQLVLDYDAFRSAEDDFRKQREFNGLDGTEAADYAAYVAGLQRRVLEDCQAVVLSGSPFPEDLPCPVIVPPVTQAADIDTQTELTPEEQIAALEDKLNTGLGEYDERLLREQERINAASPNNNSDSGTGGGAGSGAAGDGEQGDSGGTGGEEEKAEGDEQPSGATASGENETGGSGSQTTGVPSARGTDSGTNKDQPADIPDGSDDDVVARQLREAAEKETDPELKAKLWEEYRRYKQGTQ